MKNLGKSFVFALSLILFLSACGGGGGGGGKDENKNQNDSADFDVTQTLPPSLTGYESQSGTLIIKATGNTDSVVLSYRPKGDGALKQKTILPDEAIELSLNVGIAPDFELITVPLGQHCELSVDWQYQVFPRHDIITIECVEQLLTPPEGLEAYPLQWVSLPEAGLSTKQDQLRVELVQGNQKQELAFVVESGVLLFAMPDNISGQGEIHFWLDDKHIAETPLQILTLPPFSAETFESWLDTLFDEAETELLLSAPGSAGDWQDWRSKQKQAIQSQLDMLGEEEKLSAMRSVWANIMALEKALEDEPSLFGMRTMQTMNVSSSCNISLLRLSKMAALVAAVGLTSVAAGASVPLSLAVAGLVIIKANLKIKRLTGEAVDACADFRAVLASDANSSRQSVAPLMMRSASASSEQAVVTRNLHLVHEQPYSAAIRVKRVLPANVTSGVRALQSLMEPVYGLLGERLDWLYLFDFDARLPIEPTPPLHVSGKDLVANTLNVNDSQLAITLALASDAMPEKPVPFTIAGQAKAYDDWLEKYVPVSLNLQGTLTGQPPIAFGQTFTITPNEVFQFTVPIEYARSVEIVKTTKYGTIHKGAELGEFFYFPNKDNMQQDSFIYKAENAFGEQERTITFIVNQLCKVEGSRLSCSYNFESEGVYLHAIKETNKLNEYTNSRENFIGFIMELELQSGDRLHVNTWISEYIEKHQYGMYLHYTESLFPYGFGHDEGVSAITMKDISRGYCIPAIYPDCGSSKEAAYGITSLRLNHPLDRASVYRYFKPRIDSHIIKH